MWQYPTKVFQTKTGKQWLEQLKLPEMDRFEIDLLLQEWTSIEEQIATDVNLAFRLSQEVFASGNLVQTDSERIELYWLKLPTGDTSQNFFIQYSRSGCCCIWPALRR